MTHALVTVWIPKETSENDWSRDFYINEVMAPYNENLVIDSYEDDCECDDACDYCNFTNVNDQVTNPDGKWDYYSIIDESHPRWSSDLISKVLLGEVATYSMIPPEGGWLSRGDLGWFGISDNEDSDWDDKWMHVYEHATRLGYVPVICGYHI